MVARLVARALVSTRAFIEQGTVQAVADPRGGWVVVADTTGGIVRAVSLTRAGRPRRSAQVLGNGHFTQLGEHRHLEIDSGGRAVVAFQGDDPDRGDLSYAPVLVSTRPYRRRFSVPVAVPGSPMAYASEEQVAVGRSGQAVVGFALETQERATSRGAGGLRESRGC